MSNTEAAVKRSATRHEQSPTHLLTDDDRKNAAENISTSPNVDDDSIHR